MRYYTKEWYTLLQSLGTSELFEPVIDKEYTDEDIEILYQDMMDKYVMEEQMAFDEPPFFLIDAEEDITPVEFDPAEFLIGDIDENGEEVNLRNPDSYEELVEYQRREREHALMEYENRGTFDEEAARREYEENYRMYLEEPDEEVPQWIRDAVDPRLVAMWVLPERIYERLVSDEETMQERFDELDAAAEEAYEDMYADMPDEYIGIMNDLSDLEGDSVVEYIRNGSEITLVLSGWDEDGGSVIRRIILDDAAVIEDDGLAIEAGRDEDGDIESNCELVSYEIYYADDRFELHFMFSNDDLKYLTVNCGEIAIEQEQAQTLAQ